MAIFKNNRYSGKMGGLTYYVDQFGNQCTRALPSRSAAPSDKQLCSRLKFKMAMNFLQPIRALVIKSWHGDSHKSGLPFDASLGMMIKQAVEGEYPDLYVNYSRVQISRGMMDRPLNLKFVMENDEAVLTWENNSFICKASSPDDILQFVLVNEAKESKMVFEQKALRGDLSLRLALPATFGNDELHGFFFFVNHNFKEASATTYLRYVPSETLI
ncbi:DUF6266 family protein [Arcticibacter eurypsychrophilus]|uniref:DUF6266 family protein n=1 Tax=Arcticibacter eurypsychrophilus TaxID=1434752 RepID=UPI00084D4686|nr:DUF6266 family protein [Arcticibacter eurypsychrophilus]